MLFFGKAPISYLWYNPIGCGAVCLVAIVLQKTVFATR
jgi:hypothetical protein